MESKIRYFDSVKDDNTEETFRIVSGRLKNSGVTKVVLASTTGATAKKAMDYFKGTEVKLIVVPHQFGASSITNRFPSELVNELRQAGHEVHFGTMLFHTEKLYGLDVPNIIADFLRCISQGVKVCYETVLMASDAGLLAPGESVIAVAGTAKGSDTALVMQAASSRNLKDLKINEILCKPLNQL